MTCLYLQITVLESLVYSARLRFTKTVSTDIVYSFVQEVCFVAHNPVHSPATPDHTALSLHGKQAPVQLGFKRQ